VIPVEAEKLRSLVAEDEEAESVWRYLVEEIERRGRVASAVGEGSMAVRLVHQRLASP